MAGRRRAMESPPYHFYETLRCCPSDEVRVKSKKAMPVLSLLLLAPTLGSAILGIMPRPSILTSWNEIAQYVSKGVRTTQRWERELGSPVRRTTAGRKSSVLAVSGGD